MMNELIFRELIDDHLAGGLDADGKKQLADALQSPDYQALLETILADSFITGTYDLPETPVLQERLTHLLEIKTGLPLRPAITRRITPIYRWAAVAAALVLLLVGIAYLVIPGRQQPAGVTAKRNVTKLPAQQIRFKNEVPPGRTGAVLTLAMGRKLLLDTLRDGVILTEEGIEIEKRGGQVSYRLAASFKGRSDRLVFNDIATATGNQYQLLLADGTKVHLNAKSAIHYPLAFSGTDRTVSVTGEAYFEVAKNARQPFKVQLPDGSVVNVLGTHFNVNAYHTNAIRTTLVEGSVQLARNNVTGILTPGSTGGFRANGQLQVADQVNTEKATAWVNQEFYFEDDTLEEVLEQLGRWYGTNVIYKGRTEERFTGMIGRNVGLTQVLAMFENTTNIHFTIEGKTITVLQE